MRHSYATAGRDVKIDWKAPSKRIGHADVAFTMRQYVQTDLEADRQVANTLADLIIGGTLASVLLGIKPEDIGSSDEDEAHDQGDEDFGGVSLPFTNPFTDDMPAAGPLFENRPLPW